MRLRRAMIVVAAFALLATACGDDDGAATTEAPATSEAPATTEAVETTAAPEAPTTLRVARYESFDGWVLDSAAAYASYNTHLNVIEGLLRFAADGQGVEPGLAAEWVWDPEACTWTFTLQEGARFSNGDPVTAEDVAFSLEIWRAGPNFGASYESILEITGEGKTVVMHLAGVDNTIIPLMAGSVSGIMPKDFAGMTEDEYYNSPIGAGPFVVDEWALGGRIVLSRNEYFYDPERPFFDEVIIDVVGDETERQILFLGGDADIVEYLSPTVAPQYPPEVIYQVALHSVEHIGLNVLRPPFDDPLVRQAVAYAIDYEAIVAGLGEEYYQLPSGILSPNIAGWQPPSEPYFRHDLAMAQDLISRSSAADGATVEFIYDVANDLDTMVGQILQANLAEIGLDLQLTGLETGAFLDRAFTVDADITVWNYGAIQPDIADPITWIGITEYLFSGWDTTTLWDQWAAYAFAETPEDAVAAIVQFQDDAMEHAAAIAVGEGSYLHAVNPDLTGFASAPWGLYYLDTIAMGG